MEFRRKLSKNGPQEVSVFKIYDKVYDMCHATLCPKDKQGYYKKDCLERKCDKCGVNLRNFSALEKDTSSGAEFVHWSSFEYVDIKSKNDQKRKLMLVKKKHTTVRVMVDYLMKLLEKFPSHNFRALWQNNQLKTLVENLPLRDCITVHDFSENYKCKELAELQSDYFQNLEASIHVTLIYRHAILELDGVESTNES
jgi:hypothetical protein